MNATSVKQTHENGQVPSVCSGDWLGRYWRPIETAPRDNTPVDLWVPDKDERLANYVRIERSPTNVFYDPVYAGVCCVRNASHWMPIPSAPNGRDEPQPPKN